MLRHAANKPPCLIGNFSDSTVVRATSPSLGFLAQHRSNWQTAGYCIVISMLFLSFLFLSFVLSSSFFLFLSFFFFFSFLISFLTSFFHYFLSLFLSFFFLSLVLIVELANGPLT
jgi:hypothetical protein